MLGKTVINTIKLGSLYIDDCLVKGSGTPYAVGHDLKIGNTELWHELEWLPFEEKLMATKVVSHSISIADLNKLSYVKGRKITINGVKYICRIPFAPMHEWLTEQGELDEIAQAYSVYGDSNEVWNWAYAACFIKRKGATGVCSYSAMGLVSSKHRIEGNITRDRSPSKGFRPVLIPEDAKLPWEVLLGQRVAVITDGSIVYGKIADFNNYDVFLRLDSTDDAAISSLGRWTVQDEAGEIIVNRSHILHLCLRTDS